MRSNIEQVSRTTERTDQRDIIWWNQHVCPHQQNPANVSCITAVRQGRTNKKRSLSMFKSHFSFQFICKIKLIAETRLKSESTRTQNCCLFFFIYLDYFFFSYQVAECFEETVGEHQFPLFLNLLWKRLVNVIGGKRAKRDEQDDVSQPHFKERVS